ncbi:MAG: DUF6387 family protein [Porticoccaceae bacterium]|nr:DUF6387 family protein [Porticoccaceae bacterium]
MAMTSEFQAFMEKHFSLDNYSGAAELDLKGWHDQLEKRCYFFQDLHEGKADWPLEEVLNDPMAATDFKLHKRHVAIRNWNKLDYFLTNTCVALLPDEYKSLNDKYVEFHSKEFYRDGTPEYNFMKTGVDIRTENHRFFEADLLDNATAPWLHNFVDLGCSDLKVDMHFPDKELIAAFSKWLSAERLRLTHEYNQSYVKRTFGETDIETWVRFKILEYIDLKIAAHYLNSPLNDNEIAWFLLNDLPPGVNPLSRLRTVKKHAEKMIQWEIIQALDIQVRTSSL